MDIEDFLELRKNTGDDRRRTHDMNTANWVPDLLMKRVLNNEQWTLFSPSDAPDLHDLYGEAFQEKYEHYEQLAQKGEIPHRQISAVKLWRKMLSMIFETGHPWITFKDPCNIRSPQGHAGVVHSSNLCTEITLNTSKDEIAVCNLGSINLPKHFKNGQLDVEQLKKTISTAVRMLDNVIDINYYSVDTARNSNFKHRPVGLGIMGFQDALYEMQVPYSSDKAVEFADTCMEIISHAAIDASSNLAIERGVYESYKGSLWSKGILPIDSIEMLKKSREPYYDSIKTKIVVLIGLG
jgi:Ribonucleotide reductase, alpha subunit